jgi:hypothetical protein
MADPAFTAFKGAAATVDLATFTDANPGDHTADFSTAITWGDSTPVDTSTGRVSYDSGTGIYTVTGTHDYAAGGTYFASVRITDVGGFAVDTGVGLNDMGAVVTVPTQTPTAGAWYIDRYPPNGFVGGQNAFGRSGVIDQFISHLDADGSRPPAFNFSFWDFQGRKYDLPPGTTYVTMDLYVSSAWSSLNQTDPMGKPSNDGSLASLWGAAVDASNAVVGNPIIGFNNLGTNNGQSGMAGFQVFDTATNGWKNVPGFTGYNQWYQLSYAVVGGKFVYYVNGSPVYTDADPSLATAVSVSQEFLQGYNGGNDYDIFWNPVQDSQATVTDAPTALRVVAGPAFINIEGAGTGPVVLATFTDANPGDHTADFSTAINWGDGTLVDTTGSVSYDSGTGIYTVMGSHLYAEEGTFFASVRITNNVDGFALDTSVGLNGMGAVVTAPTQTAGAWYIDRYPPNGFVGGQTNAGRSGVIDEFISAADANGSRPPAFNSPFYDTQGRKYDLPPDTTYVTMDLYVPSVWAGLNQMDPARPVNFGSLASLWGTAVDGSNNVVDFPIIGFNNLGTNNGQSGTAGFQVFDSTNSWTNVPGFTGYNRWYQLSFAVVGGKFVYYVDGSPVYTDADPALATAVAISQVFLQGYNGGNSYHILWNPVQNTQATVKDAILTATATAVSGVAEGVAFTGKPVASFTDANPTAPLGDFTASINWGDGTLASPGTVTQPGGVGTAFVVNGDHTYAEEGSFTIIVSITDKGGSTATAFPTTGPNATVADAALTPMGGLVVRGTKANQTVATFTDANTAAPVSDFTGTIDWGDGTAATVGTIIQPGGAGTAFQVQGFHTYANVLKYSFPISVSITDRGGSSASAMSTASASFVVTGFPSPVTAGTMGSFTVTAKDVNGDTATGYTGTAMLSTTSAKATLPITTYMFTGTDMGVHTFTGVALKTAGTQSITATDSMVSTFTGAQTGIIVNPGAPHHFAIALFPFKPTAGVAGMFRVTIQDLYSNTVNIAPYFTDKVHFTSTDPKAVLPPDFTFTAPNTGVQDFMATLFTAGTQGITVSDVTNPMIIPASQADILVQAAAVSQLNVSGFPLFTTAGDAHSFTVTAQDQFGNTNPGYLGTVHFTSSDGAAMLPVDYKFTSGDAGQHTFMATLNTMGTQSITATDTSPSAFTGMQSGIMVQTMQPTVTVTPPPVNLSGSNGVPSQSPTITLSASESGTTTTFTYSINWGDGSPIESLPGGDGSPVMKSHQYTKAGTFPVSVTAMDASMNISMPATTSVLITVVAMEPDPTGSGTALFVGGTTGNDNIAITPSVSMAGGVKAGVNSVNYGEFFPTGHVIVYGQTGTDIIKTAAQTIGGVLTYVNVPLIIFAGNGNNTLNVSGSMAGNVLVGGGGANRLIGGLGRDVLIAGAGQSTLTAGSNPMMPDNGGAILIGGTTDYDTNAAALASILAEWSRTDMDYSMRMAHLLGTTTGGLNGNNILTNMTVHDNHVVDTLTGGSGMDWYFAGMADVIKNQASGEVVTPIM